MAASREVKLISQVWVEVTKDDISPFRMVNTGNGRLKWVVDVAQPATGTPTTERSVQLTVDESMSRFEEMTPGRLYVLGETGDDIVMID